MKCAKADYMSNLISTNSHKPQVLFTVLNRVVNPVDSVLYQHNLYVRTFPKLFVDKISGIRDSTLSCAAVDPSVNFVCSVIVDHFDPISLDEVSIIVRQLRSCQCPLDSLPPKLLKGSFDVIGHYIMRIINSSLI